MKRNENVESIVSKKEQSRGGASLRWNKWQNAQRAVSWFRLIPWVTSIWITGSLAVGNIKDSDDIDFLIITRNNRLWITRPLIVFLGLVQHKIRLHSHPANQVKDQWCCNLWLEESALDLSESHSLYSARELMQAWPVYQQSSGKAEQFIAANQWVKQYSFRGWVTALQRARWLFPRPPLLWLVFPSMQLADLIWKQINSLAYVLQRWYMQPRQKNERVNKSQAFFHPQNREDKVEAEYERIVSKLQKVIYGHS